MSAKTIPATTRLMSPPTPTVTLEPDDSCDVCGPAVIANTAVRTKRGNKLAFCNHCYRANEAGLASVVVASVTREVS